MKFTLMRHAEPNRTEESHNKWSILGLESEDILAAKTLLPTPDIVYCAPALRAYETANKIYKNTCNVKQVPLLRQIESPLETEKMFEERVRMAMLTMFNHATDANMKHVFVCCHSKFMTVVHKLFNNEADKVFDYLDTLEVEYFGNEKDVVYE